MLGAEITIVLKQPSFFKIFIYHYRTWQSVFVCLFVCELLPEHFENHCCTLHLPQLVFYVSIRGNVCVCSLLTLTKGS